jgi:hypothetical protein
VPLSESRKAAGNGANAPAFVGFVLPFGFRKPPSFFPSDAFKVQPLLERTLLW